MQEIVRSYEIYCRNERGFSDETIYKYLQNLRIIFTKLKIYSPMQLKPDLINRRWLDSFWTERQSTKPLSDSTRASYLSALKSFFKFCYIFKHISEDISQKIVMPKKRYLYREGLSKNEQKILREYLADNLKTEKDMRNTALMMFLWGTSARIGETLRLRCHLDSNIYYNERIKSGDFHVDDGKTYVHLLGKGDRDREIRVSDDVVKYLNLYLNKRKNKNEILFQNIKNNRSNSITLSRKGAIGIVVDIFKHLGLKKQSGLATHTMRHTAINHWIEKGYADVLIAAMSGHADPGSIKIYRDRDKRITDPLGEESKPTGDVESSRLKKMEQLYEERYLTLNR